MNDIDQQSTDLTDDDEVQITDLDSSGSSRHRWTTQITNLARKSLAMPWIRYSLSATLLLILLGALLLQLPQYTPTPGSSDPQTPRPTFLSATTTAGLLFIQSTDHALTAYQITTGSVHWRINLSAQSTIVAAGHSLYCYFRTTPGHTELEALDANTGRLLWHDALPAVSAGTRTGQFENFLSSTFLGPGFLYSNNTLYIQSSNDTIYAIQASTGRTDWTYQTNDQPTEVTPSPQTGSIIWNSGNMPLNAQDGVLNFLSADATLHFLDTNTGREMLSLPSGNFDSISSIDGQIIYLLPSSSQPSSAISAFHIPDGRLLWTYQLPEYTSVQTEMDGMVYLSAGVGSTLVALRGSDGHQLWVYHTSDGRPVANAFFDGNGMAYLLQHDATLVGIRVSDGQVLWRTRIAELKNGSDQIVGFNLDQGNLVIYNQDPQNPSLTPVYILRASDGKLLWNSPETITSPVALNGILYAIQNNGQINAWQEGDGKHLWNYNAPAGSAILGYPTEESPLLFLLDPAGTFSVWRPSDGKLLWRYP